MKLIITALDIIEKEAHKLREEIKKGRKLGLKDLKLILGAFGLIAGDKQFQNEAFKINVLFGAALVAFAEFTKRLTKVRSL
ncbi:hypothetical protein ES702_02439 [subsurface metagenome]